MLGRVLVRLGLGIFGGLGLARLCYWRLWVLFCIKGGILELWIGGVGLFSRFCTNLIVICIRLSLIKYCWCFKKI